MLGSRLVLACIVSGCLLVATPSLAQDATAAPKTESNGLALGLGLGQAYGNGIGAQLGYYVQGPGAWLRWMPFVGGGLAYCAGQTGETSCHVGGVFGIAGALGHKHRLMLRLSYGMLGFSGGFTSSGFADHSYYGPNLALGYEYMAFGGFHLRSDVGLGYVLAPSPPAGSGPWVLTLTVIGIGYKLH